MGFLMLQEMIISTYYLSLTTSSTFALPYCAIAVAFIKKKNIQIWRIWLSNTISIIIIIYPAAHFRLLIFSSHETDLFSSYYLLLILLYCPTTTCPTFHRVHPVIWFPDLYEGNPTAHSSNIPPQSTRITAIQIKLNYGK